MTNTAAHPDPFDVIEKAKPGEPVFTLLGRDKHAPATVLHWVGLARAEAMALDDDEQRRHGLQKCTEAELIACDMISFRKGHPEQSSAPARKTYTEAAVTDPGKLDEARRRLAIASAVQTLREAAYFAKSAQEQFAALGIDPEMLQAGLDCINGVADAFEPKRPSYVPSVEPVRGEAVDV